MSERPRVAITGADGNVGRLLIANIDPNLLDVTPIDREDCDVASLSELIKITEGHNALVHGAWVTERGDVPATAQVLDINTQMAANAYDAAAVHGLRIVMLSTTAVDESVRPAPGTGDYDYVEQKLTIEQMGHDLAADSHDEGVVIPRLGYVGKSPDIQPDDGSPRRWLGGVDLASVITQSVVAKLPSGFALVFNAVSNNDRIGENGEVIPQALSPDNPIGYVPTQMARTA